MNTMTQDTTTTFFSANRKAIIVLFVLFLLSSVGMFGQTKAPQAVEVTPVVFQIEKTVQPQVALDSDLDFLNWFMGSKQTQTVQEGTSGTTATLSLRKKQIISSGSTPNRVLYRTFVKKVISQESAIV